MPSTVKSRFHHLSVFFDPGSKLTMIIHDAARKLGLKGTDMSALNKGRKFNREDRKQGVHSSYDRRAWERVGD